MITNDDVSLFRQEVLEKFDYLVDFGRQFGKNLKQNSFKCSMTTAIEYNADSFPIRQQINNQEDEIFIIGEGIKEFTKGVFKHYDVNPSISEITKKIVDTYVFEGLKVIPQLKKALLHPANKDGVSLEFHSRIMQTINDIKEGRSVHSEEKTIYITGSKGSGKTSFFNYFISRYESELNQQNVITVRINVMKIESEKVTLEDAIKFKICRILFTYYCSWSKKDDRLKDRIIKNDIDPILNSFIENKIFKEKRTTDCQKYFRQYPSKSLKKIPENYLAICNELLSEISKDYKFIIMLDNFDQLSPNDRSKEEYIIRKEQLECIKNTSIFNYGIFLIAVRYNTYKGLKPNGRKDSECWVVGYPSTYNMIIKRMGYHLDNSRSDPEMKMQRKEYITNCIRLIGSSFTPAQKDKEILNLEEACKEIDSIFEGNKRVIMNCIERFIDSVFLKNTSNTFTFNPDKLDSFLTMNGYKFFESLLINTNNGYCNCFYEYDFVNNSLTFANIKADAHHDDNYVPNIYSFPSVTGIDKMVFSPFLKIRILQLLMNYGSTGISTNNIVDILNKIFSYREDAIRLACIELKEDMSIILRDESREETVDNDKAIENIQVQITARGKKLLKILPININILAVCLEQIYFPERFLETGIPIGNYYSESSSDFIIRNIFCSLPKVIGLFNAIEMIEKDKFLRIMRYKKYSSYFNIDMDFSIAEILEKLARFSIEKIFDTHFYNSRNPSKYSTRRDKLKEQLKKL